MSRRFPYCGKPTALAVRYAGAGSPLAIQNRLFLGEAQLAMGDQRSGGCDAHTRLTMPHSASMARPIR